MTRAKGKAHAKQRITWAQVYASACDLTMAEVAKKEGTRSGIIYEMGCWSQYADGSVLDCIPMKTYTAQEVADGDVMGVAKGDPSWAFFPENEKIAKAVAGDLKRNAKAAVKNGTTKNLAPVVGVTVKRI